MLIRSTEDANLVYLNDLSSPLAKSLSALDVIPNSSFASSSTQSSTTGSQGRSDSGQEESFLHNISMAVLSKLSKVPKFSRDAIKSAFVPSANVFVVIC